VTAVQQLRRKVWRRTAKRPGGRVSITDAGRDAEVGQDHPPAVAQVHVARLDVAVHHACVVRGLQHV
jgi:hypothetical protein